MLTGADKNIAQARAIGRELTNPLHKLFPPDPIGNLEFAGIDKRVVKGGFFEDGSS